MGKKVIFCYIVTKYAKMFKKTDLTNVSFIHKYTELSTAWVSLSDFLPKEDPIVQKGSLPTTFL